MFLHYFYLACLLASSVVGFLYKKELKSRQLSLFPWYLLAIFVQETVVFILLRSHTNISTGIIYNIYNPVSAIFFTTFYARVHFNSRSRVLMMLLLGVFLAAIAITYLWIQPISVYNNYISLAAGFLITFCSLLFLFNYFKLDNPAEEKKWLPVIWITIGLVVFLPVVNISFALYKYLLAYQATIFGQKLYRLIPQSLSIFMYGCFIMAFHLCRRKK
jgi:hypothetical protein